MKTYAEIAEKWPKRLGVRVVCAGGWVEWPVQYADGRIAYDFPERVPQFIRPQVARLFGLIKALEALK